MNKNKLDEFANVFENKIFPTIMGADGKGVERFKKIVADKRKDVENRKSEKKKQGI